MKQKKTGRKYINASAATFVVLGFSALLRMYLPKAGSIGVFIILLLLATGSVTAFIIAFRTKPSQQENSNPVQSEHENNFRARSRDLNLNPLTIVLCGVMLFILGVFALVNHEINRFDNENNSTSANVQK